MIYICSNVVCKSIVFIWCLYEVFNKLFDFSVSRQSVCFILCYRFYLGSVLRKLVCWSSILCPQMPLISRDFICDLTDLLIKVRLSRSKRLVVGAYDLIYLQMQVLLVHQLENITITIMLQM